MNKGENPKPQFARIFVDKKDIKWFLPIQSKDSIWFYENQVWKNIPPALPGNFQNSNYAIDVNYENGNPVIFAGTSFGLYMYSGGNWTRCTEGLKRKFENINNLYRNGEKLLLCTNSGLLTYINGIIDSNEYGILSGGNITAVKEGLNAEGQKVLWIIETNKFGYFLDGN